MRLAEGPLRGSRGRSSPRPCRACCRDPDREKAQRVMAAMLQMRKIEIDELERAAAGVPA